MLENANIAAQEKYNNRSFTSFQPVVNVNTAALPVVQYRVFTNDGRMMVFNDSSEASLHRYLKYIGIKYHKVQMESEYQAEQDAIHEALELSKRKDSYEKKKLLDTARPERKRKGMGA